MIREFFLFVCFFLFWGFWVSFSLNMYVVAFVCLFSMAFLLGLLIDFDRWFSDFVVEESKYNPKEVREE